MVLLGENLNNKKTELRETILVSNQYKSALKFNN